MEKTKKITISVPDTMDEKTAQQAFLLGFRTLLQLYQGGVVVSYNLDSSKGINNLAFFKNEGGAIIDFTNAIQEMKGGWSDEAKNLLEETGGEILTDLYNSSPVDTTEQSSCGGCASQSGCSLGQSKSE